jgi:hypothetical protein
LLAIVYMTSRTAEIGRSSQALAKHTSREVQQALATE